MVILSVESLAKPLKDAPLFEEVTFGMEEGDRYGVVGPNGAGKSTLLKILSGSLSSDAGTVAKARGLSVGFLHQRTPLGPNHPVEQFLYDLPDPTVELLNEHRKLTETDHAHGASHQR